MDIGTSIRKFPGYPRPGTTCCDLSSLRKRAPAC